MNTTNRLSALIVTAAVALCLVGIIAAVVVLLIGQHTVPAVAVGLITTLAAFLAPSPLGTHVGAGLEAVGAAVGQLVGSGQDVTATVSTDPAPSAPPAVPALPSVDLTQPAPPASAAGVTSGTPAQVTTL